MLTRALGIQPLSDAYHDKILLKRFWFEHRFGKSGAVIVSAFVFILL